MKKRLVAVMLTLAMCFSLVGEGICASSYTFNTGGRLSDLTADQKRSISDVLDLNIMKGDEFGQFNPNSYLTKAEACTMVIRMMNKEKNLYYVDQYYKDVTPAHWAYLTIGSATELELAKGDGNGYFNPNKSLNAIELITMCLRVMGIGKQLDETGNWPAAHMMFVNAYNIINNFNTSVYDPITRLDAARIISDFLSATYFEKNPRTGKYEETEFTIASKYLGVDTYKDVIITNISGDNNEFSGLYQDINGEYTNELEDLYIDDSVDVNKYEIGNLVNLTVRGNDIMKIEMVDDSNNRVIFYDQVTDYNTKGNYIKVKVDGRTTKYLFNENLLMVNYNGTTKTGTVNQMNTAMRLIEKGILFASGEDEDENEYDEVTGRIILDENNKVISISIWKFDSIMFLSKDPTSTTLTSDTSSYHSKSSRILKSLKLSNKEYEIRDIDGNVLDIDDLEKGDVLLVTKEEPYQIIKLDEARVGKVTYTTGPTNSTDDEANPEDDDYVEIDERYITLDDEDYYLNTKFCEYVPKNGTTKRTIYLDQNGKIVAWK